MEALQGKLLVAAPSLRDPNFRRTVVFVCQHAQGDGALGLVINRPTDLPVEEFLPDWAPHLSPPPVVFEGGPVQREAAVALARRFDESPLDGWMPVAGAVGLLDVSTPPWDVAGGVADLRVFSGYAGWSPGQLEAEHESGDWFVVETAFEDVFNAEPVPAWRRVLRRQPGRLAMLANFPEDPSMN